MISMPAFWASGSVFSPCTGVANKPKKRTNENQKDCIEEKPFAWTRHSPDETRLQLRVLPVPFLEASDEVNGEIDRHAQRKRRKDCHRHVKILPHQSNNGVD